MLAFFQFQDTNTAKDNNVTKDKDKQLALTSLKDKQLSVTSSGAPPSHRGSNNKQEGTGSKLKELNSNRKNNSSRESLASKETKREKVVLSNSLMLSSKDKSAALATTTLQPRVYREGMQYMTDRIGEILSELESIRCEFHHHTGVADDEDTFLQHLKACDAHLLRANTLLRKRSVKLEVVDSETRLVSLLNKLRELENGGDFDDGLGEGGGGGRGREENVETTQFLTELWSDLKLAAERLQSVVNKFQASVLNRLKKNYITDSFGDMQIDVCAGYTDDVALYMTQVERMLSNTHILLKSFHGGIHQDLLDKSKFCDVVSVTCDVKAFPILRVVDDVANKVFEMCQLARCWLARDEKFMLEIHGFIRAARHRTKQREEDLRGQKERLKKYERSLKAAHILLHNNRHKLSSLETELQALEDQVGFLC